MSLRTRLVLWFSGTLMAMLLVFSAVLLWLQPRVNIASLDEALQDDVVTVTGVLATETREIGPGKEATAGMLDELHLPNRGVAVLDAEGHLLGAQWNGLDTSDAIREVTSRLGTWTYSTATGQARIHVSLSDAAGVSYRIAVVSSLDEVVRESAMLRRAVVVAVPIALVLTVLGGLVAANQADDLLKRLNAALEQQRRFMADASHELRTPVSVVRTAADVTLSRGTRAEHEYRDSFRIVGEQASRLSRMVEDMFLLARADAGERHPVPAEFYFDEIVSECVRSSQLLAAAKGVQFSIEIAPDLPCVGDEALARQLVTNLLDNAVRHATRDGRVWVSLRKVGPWLQLNVSDNGLGVADEDRERIFDRFVKLDPVRSADAGAGLGLSIARWVAEAHGGTLRLTESGAGRTTFQALLPHANPAG